MLEEEKQRWASEREKNRKLMKNRGEKYWKSKKEIEKNMLEQKKVWRV